MDPRGLTTLAVGAALMLSPFAIWLTTKADPAPAPAAVAAAATEAANVAAPATQDVAQVDPEAEPGCTAAAIVST